MKLNSKKVTVQKSASELCEFLADVKNYEGLMPDTISKFEVIRDNAFVFALKGMPEIALEIKEVDSPNKVVLGAISDKLPFTLKSDIDRVSDTSSTAELLFEGEFNSMMAMMIKSPISKFIETLASNLEKL
ncbi:SRPBCC family protein [Aequorivita xiaoshiensis]|uniref:SRPBCC family protein n=1 Tax=Aequorivita xiaoshiensis TaxID=2874476 RepID=A0A9X1R326_9FLAO|nr:SRPBCC family protein [Aequorivita xiaoshiensis]MCG2430882.1 SRPBCC family protein [Aequorivita xiaoshiensis]